MMGFYHQDYPSEKKKKKKELPGNKVFANLYYKLLSIFHKKVALT